MEEMKIDLYKILPRGKEKAVSMERLGRICGLNERQVRQLVFDARCSGMVIASCPKGYYLPMRVSELKEYIETTEKRCRAGLATLPAARKKLEQMQTDPDFEQMTLNQLGL